MASPLFGLSFGTATTFFVCVRQADLTPSVSIFSRSVLLTSIVLRQTSAFFRIEASFAFEEIACATAGRIAIAGRAFKKEVPVFFKHMYSMV